jgi:hypothetical protein
MADITPTKIDYNLRSFTDIKDGLNNYIKQYYPDAFEDFTENSLGQLFVEIIAGASEILNYQIDRNVQETRLESAQLRKSILQHAKTLGLKIPNNRGSVTVCDFSVKVPAAGDSFSLDYTPILKAGTQVIGGGQVFELMDDIDFSSDVSLFGYKNRSIIPNIDANEVVQNYTLTKREIVFNGLSKVYSKIITNRESVPFYSITLPDTNVIGIDSIIVVNGINNQTPTVDQFYNDNLRWYEVDYLLQDRIFNEIGTYDNLKAGDWKLVNKKFITEFTDKGFCKITFGGGDPNSTLFSSAMSSGVNNGLNAYIDNTSLGEILPINTQVFIKYKVGGGTSSNIGANVLNTIGNVNIFVNGVDSTINQRVARSLTVTNPIGAFGGADAPSTEQIRYMISYNFSAQDRAVTLTDYLLQVYKMPPKFGRPFRVNTMKIDNKVMISILGLNSDGKLDNQSTNVLKENIANWISQKRMINDYVEIKDGRIFNLGYQISVYIDENIPSNIIAKNVINEVIKFHDIQNRQMGENIYLGYLIEAINNVTGVINVIDYKLYNKVNNGYSLNEIEQPLKDQNTREIQLIDNTLFNSQDAMFEIKYPEKDIVVLLKKKSQLG